MDVPAWSESDDPIVSQDRPASYSSNWKQLQKTLEAESPKNCEGKDGDRGFQEVKRKQRKRKSGEGIPNNANIWKKRKAEVEAASAAKQPESSSGKSELTKAIGLDCEYVGAGADGSDDVLARVSMVNQHGECVYDKYVKPTVRISDYRTHVSGIRPANLINGEPFDKVRQEVHKILAEKTVVGHALQNDFRVLNLSHTRKMTRDTSKYKPFRDMAKVKKTPSLKLLAKTVLGVDIQTGEHDSITDAKIPMRMYVLHKKKWESDVRRYQGK